MNLGQDVLDALGAVAPFIFILAVGEVCELVSRIRNK